MDSRQLVQLQLRPICAHGTTLKQQYKTSTMLNAQQLKPQDTIYVPSSVARCTTPIDAAMQSLRAFMGGRLAPACTHARTQQSTNVHSACSYIGEQVTTENTDSSYHNKLREWSEPLRAELVLLQRRKCACTLDDCEPSVEVLPSARQQLCFDDTLPKFPLVCCWNSHIVPDS